MGFSAASTKSKDSIRHTVNPAGIHCLKSTMETPKQFMKSG